MIVKSRKTIFIIVIIITLCVINVKRHGWRIPRFSKLWPKGTGQRDWRKTLCVKNVQKISRSRLKNRQNVVRNTENRALFNVSDPLFNDQVLKKELFRQFQRFDIPRVWAGVDSAWEQEKLEARKMLENAAESHTSGARFVRLRSLETLTRSLITMLFVNW